MNSIDTTDDHLPLTFVPIPIATGDTYTPVGGQPCQVVSMTVRVTFADGSSADLEMRHEGTGWWAPTA